MDEFAILDDTTALMMKICQTGVVQLAPLSPSASSSASSGTSAPVDFEHIYTSSSFSWCVIA
ncbi:hypothetical protein OBBRIDRAFT_795176 [Obba rivulosa]|uniref:Pheromone n=1 Tax=Obba rivulosa TaxID=1052685 RepID=A0A8E2ASH4_9APHY|nr:hypothetical protein OBBRIDRAFT_795176 [Obba rivulosa]